MSIEIIQPKDEQHWLSLRRDVVTSTEVAALFDCSPYLTTFELYHRKRDKTIVSIEANDRMKWGLRLEASIASGVAEDQGWSIRKMTEFIRDPELKLGASFDYSVCKHKTDGLGSAIEGSDDEDEILEVKNVDYLAFKDGWLVDGDNVEAPPHIEVQVQTQLLVSGRKQAWIAALIGGNKVQLIRRERDEKVISAIKERVAQFWKSVESGVEPSPDFRKDAEFIIGLFQSSEPGTVIGATSEIEALVHDYKNHASLEKTASEEKKAIKAQILTLIGTAEKVKGETFSISAGMIGPKEYTVKSEGYRDFRCFLKKEKAEK